MSFSTDNRIFGRTNNPYDLNRSPGGSSGGAAAIVAARASLFDIGTDTAGSIRLPAHFCGIAGLKPTPGRVPCTGNSLPSAGFLAQLTQPGPMSTCVDDLIFLLPLIAGPDRFDPYAVAAEYRDPYSIDPQKLRIGFHTDNGIKSADADTTGVIEHIVNLLSNSNCQISEVRPSGIEMTQLILGRTIQRRRRYGARESAG